MLSGIGPSWHLRELGIPVLSDLPVGENLMDHVGTGALVFTMNQPLSLITTRWKHLIDPSSLKNLRYENLPSVLKYATSGTGPLTSMGGVEGMAWIPTKYMNR